MTTQTAHPQRPLYGTSDELWAVRFPVTHDDRAILHQAVEQATTEVRGDFEHEQTGTRTQRTQDAISRIANLPGACQARVPATTEEALLSHE
jgi:hypothetical protein